MSEDRIEREISIAAPVERVWAVLTDPDHIGHWFGGGSALGARVDIDLRPGGIQVLDHGENKDNPGPERMVFPTKIVEVDPPRYFSYRWASAFPGEEADERNSTLVEFTLTPEGDHTLLRLVESGFAAVDIPEHMRWGATIESHSQGWPEVLDTMKTYAEKE